MHNDLPQQKRLHGNAVLSQVSTNLKTMSQFRFKMKTNGEGSIISIQVVFKNTI